MICTRFDIFVKQIVKDGSTKIIPTLMLLKH